MKQVLLSFFLFSFSLTAIAAETIDSQLETSQKNNRSQGDALAPYLSLKDAEHDAAQNNFAKSLESLKNVPDRDPWLFWKNILKAESLAETGNAAEALILLANLPPQPDIEHNEELDFYRLLYRKALLTQKKALEITNGNIRPVVSKLWGLYPEFETQPPPAGTSVENKLDRIRVLKILKRGNEIPAFVSSAEIASSSLPETVKCEGLFDYAQALRLVRKTDLALPGYAKAVDACHSDTLTKSLYWKGQLSFQLKQFPEGVNAFEKLFNNYPDSRYADDALYWLMKMYMGQNQPDKAKTMREKLLQTGGDMKAKLLWDDAYEAYKRKDFSKALGLLEDILKGGVSTDETTPQALYWKARILEKTEKNSAGARAIYSQLISGFPFSFYTALAANRLGTTVRLPSLPPLKNNSSSDILLDEIVKVVDILVRKNKHADARDVIDYFSQAYPDSQAINKPLWASMWNASGDYHQTLMIASSDLELNHTHPDTHHPLAGGLYPIAYPQETRIASEKTRLSRAMMEGIMREESLFLPKVRSSAGAVGLMQLMPATARIQARHDSMREDFNLENPKINILIGSSFFKKMLADFEGKLPLAIMAYNAGPGNVRKWLKSRGQLPLDEFVEEIPFTETRGYIKRVLRSMQVYGALMNDSAFRRPFFSMSLK